MVSKFMVNVFMKVEYWYGPSTIMVNRLVNFTKVKRYL